MPTVKEIKAAGGNDVGEWGEKDLSGAYPDGTTFDLNGHTIDPAKLPDLINAPGEMGDLTSTGVDGNFGDIFESDHVPLRSR